MSPSVESVIGGAAIRGILLDIEGTTTPISFVHETLFPFARARMREFLLQHHADASVCADIELLRSEFAQDSSENSPWNDDSTKAHVDFAAAYALRLMDQDRKSTALKSLQGKIWEEGYRNKKLRGEVYADVPPALARWRKQGRKVAIFSSGSTLAQKLLFANSTAGDLTHCLHSYFDTTTGPKQNESSYRRIAELLEIGRASCRERV